ncbi:class I SAM-dependent methyltransferase [Ramlibacter humi]|uniref:Class I SAM-dependent methyltransferase n=1 Tax=Ramlibacter humi TaxID=2530451 RepID=A0A4Z0BIC2_9BURK|nr:SAM-dependent methyltransferase [Ramlibacter humi]TFY99062.1 class I SAM-dependent methyltransferase [Ramlibacter humi]
MSEETGSLTSALGALIGQAVARDGGWLPFDRFMALALYAPGLGYYANASRKFGAMPSSGSDFVTAPELTPLFGRALARQVAQALEVSGTKEVWEFGAGSGALAQQLLEALGDRVQRYTIVDLSGSLRSRQRQRLAAFGDRVRWAAELPGHFSGVIVGNEVLDAMPVKLLHRVGGAWHERGVAGSAGALRFEDRPTGLRPPIEVDGPHDYLTEIHPQAQAFIRTLADRLEKGAAFFIDYGFPEREYWHPQRHMGTLMCHRGHLADADPLSDVGVKDITAHVDFTGIAVAAQDSGLNLLGYTTQAHFLFNCGVLELAADADLAQRAAMQKLVNEHEMGELFKVIGLAKGGFWEALGFARGDRTDRL